MPADQKCPGLFVTGTDTGVGKTLVTAALARFFSSQGLRVGVMKPCETGVADPGRPGDDARLLQWAAGSHDTAELIAPFRFSEPLAPALAASRAGASIEPHRIADALTQIRQDKDLVLVEGAGGLMVPVRGGFLMADLARQLDLPLLIVARPGLGTLNHTLLTAFAARAMELPLVGVLINRMPASPSVAEAEAPHLLASLASTDLLGVLPEVSGPAELKIERLSAALADMPTLPWLRQALGLPGKPPGCSATTNTQNVPGPVN